MAEGPRPAPVTRLLAVLVGAALVVAVVVVLYDRGWLPIAGPFAGVAVAGAVVYSATWWRQRRLVGLLDRARTGLEQLRSDLADEQALPAAQRRSGADDRALVTAAQHVGAAQHGLAESPGAGAAAYLAPVQQLAAGWSSGSPLRARVDEVAATLDRVDRVVQRMRRVAGR